MNNTFEKFCHCIPVNSIEEELYDRLQNETEFIPLNQGELIFSIGDNDSDSLFLLAGEIELFSKDGKKSIITAQDKQSLFALASLKPRLFDAHALEDVLIAKINTEMLDKLLIWEQCAAKESKTGVEVDDISFCFDDINSDWKIAMLQTSFFLKLPAANIISLFDNMEEIEVKKDQQIIKYGDPGDFYYIIKSGSCVVTHSFQDDAEQIIINELEATDSFGEDALVSGSPRNANVTMRTDGVLVRLAKDIFHSMLQEPLLNWVDKQQAKKFIEQGATPIDVRTEEEFNHSGIKNTLNIPFYLFRIKIKSMDKEADYVLFCNNGSRSSAAAFIMAKQGFKNVYLLTGGLDS